MVTNYGFTETTTPTASVQEFYREQGEMRLKKRILAELREQQRFQIQVTRDDVMSLDYVIFLIGEKF